MRGKKDIKVNLWDWEGFTEVLRAKIPPFRNEEFKILDFQSYKTEIQ